jgi:hypothetical protein
MYEQVMALKQALDAAIKTVNIEIAKEDLQTLKDGKYKLCFAKKVGTAAYNVVWQSYDKYLVSNSFSWEPVYQLFGSNQFKSGVQVKVATNLVTIGLGEQSVLNEAGILGPPKTGGPATGFTLVNNYGTIHPGVNQLSIGIHGEMVSTPIYVATNPVVSGDTALTPVEKVLVWFQQDVATSTMFSQSVSKSIEIDLTNTNQATRLYADQKWKTT